MDNKFILGLCIIGFGILLLFADQEHSWIFSALAVGIGTGIIIKKSEKIAQPYWAIKDVLIFWIRFWLIYIIAR